MKKAPKKANAPGPEEPAAALLGDVRALIEEARGRVAQAVNASLVLLYWHIGTRIGRDVLGRARAEYGEQIVQTLSGQLTEEYGRGFSRANLFSMIRFAEVFPGLPIVQTLSAQLSWSHFVEIAPLQDDLQRDFYAELCRVERWSVRTLQAKIRGMLYERTALSRKPEALIRQELSALREDNRLTPDLVFRDPYVLDFLGLQDAFSEEDLRAAILRELESFLLECALQASRLELRWQILSQRLQAIRKATPVEGRLSCSGP